MDSRQSWSFFFIFCVTSFFLRSFRSFVFFGELLGAHLIQNMLQPAKQLSMEDPRRWFDHFDPQHTGKLSSHQLLRALCKTNPGLKIDGASALVQRLELVPPGTDQIDYAHFLAIHEILKGALDAGASPG